MKKQASASSQPTSPRNNHSPATTSRIPIIVASSELFGNNGDLANELSSMDTIHFLIDEALSIVNSDD